MDKDSSFQSGFTFSGIKPEFRPGFIDQVRSFAQIGHTEASRLEACGEAWVKGIERLVERLQCRFGLRNRTFDQILYHGIEGDLTKEQCIAEVRAIFKFIQQLCDPEKPKQRNKNDKTPQEPETPFQTGVCILRTGTRQVPSFHDILGWFQAADEWGAVWPKSPSPEPQLSTETMNVALTESQRTVYDQLAYALWLRGSSYETVAKVWSRPFPLLMGSSGSGKTTVVRKLAADKELPLLILDSGGWIVEGANRQPSTLTWIRDRVERAPRGIVFVDEVDKFSAAGDWCKHIQQELMALLDARLDSYGWSADTIQRFRKWIIIGTGTWQDQVTSTPMGFVAEQDSGECRIRRQKEIPEELLARFNSRWLYVSPPAAADIHMSLIRIHKELHLPVPNNLEALVNEAVDSGQNMRWLERYLSDLLYTQYQATRLSTPPFIVRRREDLVLL